MQRSDTAGLHPFVKAGIAYMGIMAGFAVLGLTFYVIAASVEAPGPLPPPPMMYYAAVSYYVAVVAMSVATVWLLKNGRRTGAYVAFATLAVSLLAPSNGLAFGGFTIIYWFAIPNAAVGLLLLKAYKTLR